MLLGEYQIACHPDLAAKLHRLNSIQVYQVPHESASRECDGHRWDGSGRHCPLEAPTWPHSANLVFPEGHSRQHHITKKLTILDSMLI